MSGATIMAPITVAVELLTTPADAITAESGSRSQNRLSRRLRSGPSKKSWSRIRLMSAWPRPLTNVVPPAGAGQLGPEPAGRHGRVGRRRC